jgi:spermidine/putrescine transport system permease protein
MVKIIDKRWADRELIATATPATLVQVVFFVVPVVMLIILTFQSSVYFQLVWTWDISTWNNALGKTHHWTVLGHTLVMAVTCVTLSLLIAFPVAYALATRLKAFENHIKILIIFAFLTDLVLKTYGWVLFLDQHGLLNWLLKSAALVGPGFDHKVVFTPTATMIGMVYNLLPYMIFTTYLSILGVDRNLIQAAYDCGASKLRTFWEITLPLCRPGIWAGTVLVFVLSLGALIEEKVIGGGMNPVMSELIHQNFGTRINWALGATLTVLLMAAATVIVVAFSRMYRLNVRALG